MTSRQLGLVNAQTLQYYMQVPQYCRDLMPKKYLKVSEFESRLSFTFLFVLHPDICAWLISRGFL